jgi:PAS domain S-box-containing protein
LNRKGALSFCKAFLQHSYLSVFDREMARANLRLRLLMDEVKGHALFTVDKTGLVTSWNRGAERIFGHKKSDVVGQHFSRFFTQEDIQSGAPDKLLQQAELSGRANDQGWQIRKDGTRFFAEGSLVVLGRGSNREFGRQTHDVTKRRNAEETLRQAQKMDAIGRLAGGVAHDFNNLLTIISGYSEMVMDSLSPKDPQRPHVQIIIDAGVRAASLTHQLLTFSRQTVLEPKVVSLNELVCDAERMFQRLIGENVVLTTVLDPKAKPVKVDPSLFGQVLLNLIVNARDAMPLGGNLTIETCNVNWEQDYAATHPQIPSGQYVMLSTTDTGCGMTPESSLRIFEPFYTTKEAGKGTGLGLAVVHGIIKQSNGYIQVYSEPALGTTFKIYLPAVEDEVTVQKALENKRAMGGAETILLVEDEKDVRGLALHALQSHGYKVLSGIDGKDGMRVAGEYRGVIDLLVTDVVMPGMGGRQLAEALGPEWPKMKVLFTSGYTDDAVVRHGILQKEVAFLQKPYTPLSLTTKVRAVLDQTNAVAPLGR